MNSWLALMALLLAPTAVAQQDQDWISLEHWKVHLGDDLRWAAADFDDHAWADDQIPGQRVAGYRWYRASVALPEAWKGRALALAFGPMGEAFEVYVDGIRTGGLGVLEPAPVSAFVRHLALTVPAQPRSTLHVAVRRWMGPSTPYFPILQSLGSGYFDHVPHLGLASLIETRERLHTLDGETATAWFRYSALIQGIVGILALVLFAQRRNRRDYLWLGLGILLQAVAVPVIVLAVTFDLPVRSFLPALGVELTWVGPSALMLFFRQLCPPLRWPLQIVALLFLLFGSHAAATMVFLLPVSAASFVSVATVAVVAQAATAILLWRDRQGFILAAALLLTSAVPLVIRLGLLPFEYFWRGYQDTVTRLLFAVTTLAVLYLRSQAEERTQQARERELAAGQRVQQLLLGSGDSSDTPGFLVERAYLPAREVGGDFYQIIPRPDGGLLAVVGDVSGKGLEAAMLGARLLGALAPLKSLPPGAVLAQLNEAIRERSRGGFATCCCVLFSPDGAVTIANAGHPSPYVAESEVETVAGLPLGVAADVEYPETSLLLKPGNSMTFVTDGVVEAENAQRELFGFDRTRDISTKPAREIAEAAKAWGQNDDITVVTVRRNT